MNIEFFIDNQQVDLFDLRDNPVKFNYLLIDLQFLDKRGGAATNIFKVPATKNNNQIFNFYYDTQQTNPWKFVEQKPAMIIAGGITLLDGYVKGKAVYIKHAAESYEIMVTGYNLNWGDGLKGMKLVDLDLPTINYDESTVRDSWTNTDADQYVAPLALYHGLTNPIVGGGPMVWDYKDFHYWLFLYPLLEEMFRKLGFRLKSDFMQNPTPTFDFKKLVVHFNDTNAYAGAFSPINFKEDVIDKDRNCLDLFKGVANLFNLMVATDPLRREVYIEPYDTFFAAGPDVTDKVDLSQARKMAQYTDVYKNLSYAMKDDAFGPYYWEDVKEQSGYFPDVYTNNRDIFINAGMYKSGFVLDVNAEETKLENYFAGYFTGKIAFGSDLVYVPLIFAEYNFVAGIAANDGTSEPRIGYYAGITAIKDADTHAPHGSIFKYHADAATNTRPFLYICDYAGEEHSNNFHYSNQWDNALAQWKVLNAVPTSYTPVILPGLIQKHYKNFLYSMMFGRYMEVPLRINPTDLATGLNLKEIQFYFTRWIMLEISNYNAANNLPALCKLLENIKATQAFIDGLVYGGDYTTIKPI